MKRPDPADPLSLLDPELVSGALMMRDMTARFCPMSDQKLALRRGIISSMMAPPHPDVTVEDRVAPGHAGEPDVRLFVVNAQPGAFGPGVLHLHGGGYNAGSAMGSMPHVQDLARALNCPVVSVDYRIAPETRFAGSVEDNYAGLRWMHAHAAEIGVDPARIAVLGESAGGGHAALLTIAARDRGELPILFQVLLYPMLDDRTGSTRPVPNHIGTFGWNEDANRFGWRSLLGCEPGGDDVPVAAVPARVENLAGLPPAFIGVGALDLFVDENIAYARHLIEAGVPTELVVVPGAFHGFDMMAHEAAASRRFTAAKLDALRRAFRTTTEA